MSAIDPADVLFEDWRRRVDEGESVSPEEVMAAHPDAADDLRERFDAVRLLDGALGASRHPSRIGEYTILHEIGRGGMGVVYEARQDSLKRRVAVKVLYPSVAPSGNAVKRFRQEAQAAGRLKHTNIVAVYALGEEDGLWYCAMELVDGPPLARVLDRLRKIGARPRGGSPPSGTPSTLSGAPAGSSDHYRRVARVFSEVADALHTAHESGVVHRDVKPGNLLLDGGGHLRLTDFGLARLDEGAAHMTRTGDLVGTPLYMSPEQFRGSPDAVGPATDIYSLGATLYEVLTLRPPHPPMEAARLAAEILSRDPALPRSIDAAIPRDLETVCMKALEKEPSRRYASAAAFADDLRSFAAGDAVRARRAGPFGRLARRVRRHPMRFAAGVAVLGAVSTAAILGARSQEDRDLRRRAEYDLLLRRAVELRPEDESEGSAGGGALYAKAIELDDGRPDAHVARALVGGGTVGARLKAVDAAQSRGIPQETASLLRAYILTEAGQEEEGEAAWRSAGEVATRHEPLGGLVAGMRAALGQQPEEALARYDEVVRTASPGSVLLHLVLTRRIELLIRTGGYERALADVLTLRARGDDRIRTAAIEAWLWQRLGKVEEAETRFAALLARSLCSLEDAIVLADVLQPMGAWAWIERVTGPGVRAFPKSPHLWSLHSEALNGRGDWSGALAACERAIGLVQGSAALEALRARYLANARRREDALAAAERAGVLAPDDPKVLLAQAEVYRRFALVAQGTRAAERALHLDRRSVEARRVLGVLRILDRRFPKAEELLAQAVASHPMHPGVHRALALLRLAEGRHADALRAVDKAEAIEPDVPEHAWLRGKALNGLERYKEAADSYRRAVSLRADFVEAWQALGRVLVTLSDWDRAIEALKRAVALDARHVSTWNELGLAYLEKNQLEEAEKAFRAVLEIDANQLEALGNLAGMLLDAGKPADALPLFERLALMDPTDARTQVNLALALESTGQKDKAVAVYQIASKLDPKDAKAYLLLGSLLVSLGKTTEAADAFRRAADAAPNDAMIHRDLAELQRRSGDRAAAKVSIERAIFLAGDHADSHGILAELLAFAGDLPGAVKSALQARGLAPQDFRHARNAAGYLSDVGRFGDAADAFLLAVERFPDRPEAHFLCGWYLATAPDRAVRAPGKAVKHARRAMELDSSKPTYQLALGAALCADQRLPEGIRELEAALARDEKEDPPGSFLLAMAYHRVGRAADARAAFDRACASRRASSSPDEEARLMEQEAAEVLGIPVPR